MALVFLVYGQTCAKLGCRFRYGAQVVSLSPGLWLQSHLFFCTRDGWYAGKIEAEEGVVDCIMQFSDIGLECVCTLLL